MIGRPVAAAHLVLGLLAARLGPLDSHTPHLGEPGCAEEGRPVMGVSAAMFKWGAGPRDHTRNVQGLVMLYNIKTTYTLHGACACNPETVLKTRRGGDARALQGLGFRVRWKARDSARLNPRATCTVSLHTHSPASHAAAQGCG